MQQISVLLTLLAFLFILSFAQDVSTVTIQGFDVDYTVKDGTVHISLDSLVEIIHAKTKPGTRLILSRGRGTIIKHFDPKRILVRAKKKKSNYTTTSFFIAFQDYENIIEAKLNQSDHDIISETMKAIKEKRQTKDTTIVSSVSNIQNKIKKIERVIRNEFYNNTDSFETPSTPESVTRSFDPTLLIGLDGILNTFRPYFSHLLLLERNKHILKALVRNLLPFNSQELITNIIEIKDSLCLSFFEYEDLREWGQFLNEIFDIPIIPSHYIMSNVRNERIKSFDIKNFEDETGVYTNLSQLIDIILSSDTIRNNIEVKVIGGKKYIFFAIWADAVDLEKSHAHKMKTSIMFAELSTLLETTDLIPLVLYDGGDDYENLELHMQDLIYQVRRLEKYYVDPITFERIYLVFFFILDLKGNYSMLGSKGFKSNYSVFFNNTHRNIVFKSDPISKKFMIEKCSGFVPHSEDTSTKFESLGSCFGSHFTFFHLELKLFHRPLIFIALAIQIKNSLSIKELNSVLRNTLEITTPKFVFENRHNSLLSTSIRGGEKRRLMKNFDRLVLEQFQLDWYYPFLLLLCHLCNRLYFLSEYESTSRTEAERTAIEIEHLAILFVKLGHILIGRSFQTISIFIFQNLYASWYLLAYETGKSVKKLSEIWIENSHKIIHTAYSRTNKNTDVEKTIVEAVLHKKFYLLEKSDAKNTNSRMGKKKLALGSPVPFRALLPIFDEEHEDDYYRNNSFSQIILNFLNRDMMLQVPNDDDENELEQQNAELQDQNVEEDLTPEQTDTPESLCVKNVRVCFFHIQNRDENGNFNYINLPEDVQNIDKIDLKIPKGKQSKILLELKSGDDTIFVSWRWIEIENIYAVDSYENISPRLAGNKLLVVDSLSYPTSKIKKGKNKKTQWEETPENKTIINSLIAVIELPNDKVQDAVARITFHSNNFNTNEPERKERITTNIEILRQRILEKKKNLCKFINVKVGSPEHRKLMDELEELKLLFIKESISTRQCSACDADIPLGGKTIFCDECVTTNGGCLFDQKHELIKHLLSEGVEETTILGSSIFSRSLFLINKLLLARRTGMSLGTFCQILFHEIYREDEHAQFEQHLSKVSEFVHIENQTVFHCAHGEPNLSPEEIAQNKTILGQILKEMDEILDDEDEEDEDFYASWN